MEKLTEYFNGIYSIFRIQLYKDIFSILNEKEGSLSATEYFAAEVIYLLDDPTISQFAEFLDISSSHAAYKVKSLVNKGYVIKLPTNDKRTFTLKVTDKFTGFYHNKDYYGNYIMKKLASELEPKKVEELGELLELIITQIDLDKKGD